MAHRTSSAASHKADSVSSATVHDGATTAERLIAAYAVMHGVHCRAAQLLDETTALLTLHYASASSPSSSVLWPRTAEQRRGVEDLLLSLTTMQVTLTTATAESENEPRRRRSADQGDGTSPAAAVAAAVAVAARSLSEDEEEEREAVSASLSLLRCGLPPDWPEALTSSTGAHQPQQQQTAHRPPSSSSSSAPPEVLTCPADVVQLAILLRRQWSLQRDLTLAIPALLSLLTADSPSSRLRVALALAIPQLSRAPEMLETQSLPQQHLASAFTTLPVLLWHVWSAEAAGTQRSPSPTSPGEENTALVAASAAAAAQGSATARQLTKKLYKWEAHVAAYVTAELARGAGGADSSRTSTAFMTDADVAFLTSTLEELTVLRGACHATQLLWLTIAVALHPLPSASSTSSPAHRADALRDVSKRCAKLEMSLRPLLQNTVTAPLLLPGVLLWKGVAALARPPATASGGQQQQQRRSSEVHQCWQETELLGRQVFGAAHPLMLEVKSLLRSHAPAPQQQQHSEESARLGWAVRSENPLTSPAPSPVFAASMPPPRTAPSLMAAPLATVTLPPVPQLSRLPSPPRTAPSQHTRPSPPPPRQQQQQQQQQPTRIPDTTRAFTTAISARRPPSSPTPPPAGMLRSARPPSHTLQPIHEAAAPPLVGAGRSSAATNRHGNTFPLPATAAAAAAAADATGDVARAEHAATAGVAAPPAPFMFKAPGKKKRANGVAALRNCHRIANPADALKLLSSVPEAVFEDDLAHTAAMARPHGRRKRKGNKGQRDTVASTKALLLSAVADDSITSTGADSSASNPDESRQQRGGRSRRRRRPDRMLMPPLTNVRRATGNANADVDGAALPPDPLSPFANDGGGDPFWSHSMHDDSRAAESITTTTTTATAVGTAEQRNDSTRGSAAPHKEVGGVPQLCVSHVAGRGASRGSEEGGTLEEGGGADAEEEEYDQETLPERNARMLREVRIYYEQLNERRVHAAAVIQRGWRCSQARQILRTRQQQLYRYVFIIQKAAALALEGFILAVWQQRARRAALTARTTADTARQQLEQRQVTAARVLTRAVRQWGQRQRERRRLREQLNLARDARLRRYEVTAVVVQRWWRVTQPRKAYWRQRQAQVAAQRAAQAAADRLARAATTIQRRVRGVQARARVTAVRRQRAAEAHTLRLRRDAAVTVLTIVLQEHVRRVARVAREAAERQERQEDAALRIAESCRAALERRRLELAVQRARQLRTSATRIQRAWRRYIAGRQRRYLRQTRRTLHEERVARELCVSTSVVMLQCAVRGAADVVLVRRLKARAGRTFMESLIFLQSILRGWQARLALGTALRLEHARQRDAAAAAEKHRVQSLSLLQALLRGRRSALTVQRRLRTEVAERLHVHTAVAREMQEDVAATVVQRAVRRHLHRRHTAAAHADAVVAITYLHDTARCVQQTWRGYVARRERRRRAAAVARGAARREEREEVMELVWRDQKRELDMLYLLEQHYLVEAEHAARVALYRACLNPSSSHTAAPKRPVADTVENWAALYVD